MNKPIYFPDNETVAKHAAEGRNYLMLSTKHNTRMWVFGESTEELVGVAKHDGHTDILVMHMVVCE